jgi:hypothetical protein
MIANLPRAGFKTFASILFRAFVFSVAMALTGCGTQYGQLGVTGGFTDKMISENTGVVVVSGNAFASTGKIESILMLRAAEMTLQSGHQRFSLLTIEDQAALDAQRAGRLPAYLRAKAAQGNFGPRLRTEHTTVSSQYATFELNKSGGGFFVVMYKAAEGGAYDARKLVAELRPKLEPRANEQAALTDVQPGR